MKTNTEIAILYPLKPPTLSVQLISESGVVHLIQAVVNEVTIDFIRNEDGFFKASTNVAAEKSYIFYIERQLTRLFA